MKQPSILGGSAMKKNKINLNKEDGSGLVLALMVLLVLSVLGASLGVVTIGSLQLSDVNHDTNSAYYIAEAGVNIAYEEFKEIVSDTYRAQNKSSDYYREINKEVMKEIIDEESFNPSVMKTYNQFGTQFGDEPVAKVSIAIPEGTVVGNEREYTIKSVGEINGKKRSIEKKILVIWKTKSTAGKTLNIPDNAALIVNKSILLPKKGNKKVLDGFIYLVGKNFGNSSYNKYSNNITGKIIDTYTTKEYEEFVSYVNDLDSKVDEVLTSNENEPYMGYEDIEYEEEDTPLSIKLKEDTKIKKLELKDGLYNIEIGNNDVAIYLTKLTIDEAKINIIGTGTLTFVVSGDVKIEESEFSSEKSQANIRIVSTGYNHVEIEESTVYAQIIAPKSEVEIKKAKIFGSVIAEEVEMEDNSYLTYNNLIFNGSETEVNIDDLLEPEPVVESD